MRSVTLSVDGHAVTVADGSTVKEAAEAVGVDIPTLCWAENLTPVNVCRICVVELKGARTLIPACARRAEAGMEIETDSPRVRSSVRS